MSVDALADIHVEDIEYLRHPSGPLLARIYRPKEGRPRAALVSMHGGRWTRETRLTNAVIDEALARDGALVMALDIRMPPVARLSRLPCRHQLCDPLAQGLCAHAGCADDRVGGIGTSSGGHQMTLSALRPRDPRYAAFRGPDGVDASLAFLIAGWPVLDPLARYKMAKAQGNGRACSSAHHAYWPDEAAQAEGNPQMILDRGERVELPPALVIQGTGGRGPAGPTWPTISRRRIARPAVPIDLRKFDGQPHTFITKEPAAPASQRSASRSSRPSCASAWRPR